LGGASPTCYLSAHGAAYPIRRRLIRFSQVDNRRRLLLAEAVGCLLVARLALLFIPFPRLARRSALSCRTAGGYKPAASEPRVRRSAAPT
jgi:hypothetical protein